MTRGQLVLAVFLSLLVVVSGVGVVYAKYASRKHFLELQGLQGERDALDVEWGRLQLELSTWATHGRIESEARERLKMHMPKTEEVVLIRLEP